MNNRRKKISPVNFGECPDLLVKLFRYGFYALYFIEIKGANQL